ncbi:hypothetical protein AGOR_G00194450 [Albula goreensis]|uniref:Uncharacterized protein n=1 Tax=Albula goreensis TaxID=1534307 RepID=A0A8T3CVY5_9TELE|nr:hypothetical protein AGOR_G00194450 [Albula goreensis]
MSNCVAFHTQIASIMEVLANAAVAEICKLVDDGYAVLRLEMSQSQKENKALKRKLQMMELRVARACAEKNSGNARPQGVQGCEKMRRAVTESHFPGEGGVFTRPLDGQRRDGDAADTDQDHTGVQHNALRAECADMEEGRTEPLLIKEERLEEESDPLGKLNIKDGPVESRPGGGERPPIQEVQNKAANHTEELSEQQRTRHGVWECVDGEERKPESLLVKEEGPEQRNCDPRGELRERENRAVETGGSSRARPASLNTQAPPAGHSEELTGQHRTMQRVWERVDAEEGRIEPLFIKEERPEEDGDPLGELINRKDRFVESGLDGVGQVPSVDRQTRPSIWEVSGPETARKTKRQRDRGKTLQPSAPEQSAARLTSPCPEYLLCERSSQLRTLFSQGGGETEAGDPSCSYAAEANSESLSFHSELQSGPPAGKGAGGSLSVGSLDVKPEVVMIDSVPTEEEAEMHSVWSEEAVSGNVPAQHRLYREERDRMEIITGNVDMCPPYAQIPVRDTTAGPHFMAPDINAFVPFDRNLSLPKGLGTLMARKKERLFSCTYCGKAFNRPKKPTDGEQRTLGSLLIKEERAEEVLETSDPHTELMDNEEGFVESSCDSVGQDPSMGRQTRWQVWEVGGLEASLRASQGPGGEGLDSLAFEPITSEGPGHPRRPLPLQSEHARQDGLDFCSESAVLGRSGEPGMYRTQGGAQTRRPMVRAARILQKRNQTLG